MPLSHDTFVDLDFTMHILYQEIPFGLRLDFPDEVKPLMELTFGEMNDEQARILIENMLEQRRKYFKETYYGDESCKDIHI